MDQVNDLKKKIHHVSCHLERKKVLRVCLRLPAISVLLTCFDFELPVRTTVYELWSEENLANNFTSTIVNSTCSKRNKGNTFYSLSLCSKLYLLPL